jgi:hypothetical protein
VDHRKHMINSGVSPGTTSLGRHFGNLKLHSNGRERSQSWTLMIRPGHYARRLELTPIVEESPSIPTPTP